MRVASCGGVSPKRQNNQQNSWPGSSIGLTIGINARKISISAAWGLRNRKGAMHAVLTVAECRRAFRCFVSSSGSRFTRDAMPMSDPQPLGPHVDATPARPPAAVSLVGRFGGVERLEASRHGETLWRALEGHGALWAYMAHGPFAARGAFTVWLTERQALADPFYYAIVDGAGRALGLAALMAIRPDMRVVEVGNIVLAPALQRSALATEAQYLLARYAFETLRYRRYEWKCDALNAASRRAALRLGFVYEGIFRQHMLVKGRNRDTAWFAMTDADWPGRKAAFERWLAPANFDPDGRQRVSLRALNGAVEVI